MDGAGFSKPCRRRREDTYVWEVKLHVVNETEGRRLILNVHVVSGLGDHLGSELVGFEVLQLQ